MLNYIETYKGYDISYEDNIELTANDIGYWVVSKGSWSMLYYGTYSLKEIEKIIDSWIGGE